MARICSGCNKFASLEAEVDNIEGSIMVGGDTIYISIECAVVLNSQCCSMEVARADISEDHDLAVEAIEHTAECESGKDEDNDASYSVDDIEGECGERYQTTDRNGKTIRSARYQRKFYMVDVSGTVSCDECDASAPFNTTIEEQASGFEDSN
jgi:hypothetical protein